MQFTRLLLSLLPSIENQGLAASRNFTEAATTRDVSNESHDSSQTAKRQKTIIGDIHSGVSLVTVSKTTELPDPTPTHPHVAGNFTHGISMNEANVPRLPNTSTLPTVPDLIYKPIAAPPLGRTGAGSLQTTSHGTESCDEADVELQKRNGGTPPEASNLSSLIRKMFQ